MKKPEKRCINLDWLEVYCLEDLRQPLEPDALRSAGMWVVEREYGTRIYAQMYKLNDNLGNAVLEVRRLPKQAGLKNSILPVNACHIRLSNRSCYRDDAVSVLRGFLSRFHVELVKISRVDIALDFEKFDSGDDPQKFVARYIKGKYAKINQSKGRAFFEDEWSHKTYNSVAWGKKKSPIDVKMYNKSKELAEVSDKPYIKSAWFDAGLIDSPISLQKIRPDGSTYQPVIWRVEFSIKGDARNWITYEEEGNTKQKRSFRNVLELYDTREKLLSMFASLCAHYFHFRKFKQGKSKYECPEKRLFEFGSAEQYIRVEHPAGNVQPNKEWERLRKLLAAFYATHPNEETKQAISTITKVIDHEEASRFVENPYNSLLVLALQQAIAQRLEGSQKDPQIIVNDIFDMLKNTEATY